MSWELKSFDELGFIGRGKSRHRPRNDESLYGGEFPLIQTGDVKNANLYITEYSQTYSQKGLDQSKLWEPNTLCITIAANIADTTILGIQACFPDSIIGFVADENVCDVRFIKYHFDIVQKQMQMVSQGATQDNLSLEKLLKFKVPTPPLETQKRIASILSNYDDLIENNLKRIKLLEETAQNIYKEWFVNFRFPNYEHTEFDAESGLPVGWEMKKLSELYNTSSGGTPKRDNPNYYEGSIKWIRTNELQDNFLIDSELHISEDALKNSSAKLFPKNTVLMAMYGATIGRLGVLTEEASTNQACCGIIPISEDFGNSYIYYWLLKNREHILSLRMGAAQENISQTIIKDLDVMKPDLNIIKEFNSKIDKINELKINLTVQNQKLKEARDILLPRLMNRTIEV